MQELLKQPFFSILEQTKDQTGDTAVFEKQMEVHLDAFKEYLVACCKSDLSILDRFRVLKKAEYKLKHLHVHQLTAIKSNPLYSQWMLMILDALHFINTEMEVLVFHTTCPAHLFSQSATPTPAFKWTGSRNDLTEAIAGLYYADVIRLPDGGHPSFSTFAKCIGGVFGMVYANPHNDLHKILKRKRERTPFLFKIISVIRGNNINTMT